MALLSFLPPLHIVFLENTPQRVNKAFAYCLFKIDPAGEVVEPGIFGFFVNSSALDDRLVHPRAPFVVYDDGTDLPKPPKSPLVASKPFWR